MAEIKLQKMRYLTGNPSIYDELKKLDPETAITRNCVKVIAKTGMAEEEIRFVPVGIRSLVNFEDFINYLNKCSSFTEVPGAVRKII